MAISNKLRPEQIEVTTGSTDNDTVTTKGYVDETIASEVGAIDFWTRVTGTSNYLIPDTAADDIGAVAARINKVWMDDFDSTAGSCDTFKTTEVQTTTGITVNFNNPNTTDPLWNFSNSAGARFTIANVDTTALELESKAEDIYFKVPTGKGFEWQVNSVPKMSLDATNGLSLASGGSVNEIVTTVWQFSTDDQLPTAKAVYDAILAADKGSVPATPTSTGTTGQWAYGSSYMYRCVATDTWVRWAVVTSWS